MRFSFMLDIKQEFGMSKKGNIQNLVFTLPTDYRIGITSLFKEALQQQDKEIFNFYYNNISGKIKPFTFSTYIKNPRLIEKNILAFNNSFILVNFSSNDMDFFMKNLD